MNRRSVVAAVAGGCTVLAGCASDEESRSDPATTEPPAPDLDEADRERIIDCEQARIRDAYFDGQAGESRPRITTVGTDGAYRRVELETAWGDRLTRAVIRVSSSGTAAIDGVPSSSSEPFADLDGFQRVLSVASRSGSAELTDDADAYEATLSAIRSAFSRFETGDAVYIEHDDELLRLHKTSSRGEPEYRIRTAYFLSASELRRVTEYDGERSPDDATVVDC